MALTPLDGTLFGDDQPCFGCGPQHPFGFHLKFEHDGDGVKTLFTPGGHHQGPPGIMHGGLVMTLADEVAAWALLAKHEKFGFTTSAECKFRKPVRINVAADARAQVVKFTSRVVRIAVQISQANELCFEGLLTFAMLDRGGAEKMLQGPLAERLLRFAR